MASAALQGKVARCPACGGTLHIPAQAASNDILALDPLLTMGGNLPGSALSRPSTHLNSSGKPSPNQNTTLLIGGIIAAAAVVLIVLVTVVAVSMSGRGQVAQVPALPGGHNTNASAVPPPANNHAANSAASSALPPTPPRQSFDFAALPASSATASSGTSTASGTGSAVTTSLPPGAYTHATVASNSSTTDASSQGSSGASSGLPPKRSAFEETIPEGGAKVGFLPSSVQTWHAQDNRRLKGFTRVGDSELAFAHYSWMTQLLPFLGHQKEYDRFDFSRPLTDDRNIQVGGEVIPAFLNPLDDRPRWKGYPFEGLALTHFAGMAGVEDSRNVVAGALPRSDPRAGVFGYDEVARPEEITDGTSQTVMIVGTGSLASPWIFGGGATIRGAREPYFDKVSGLGTRNLPQPGTITVMADGSVRFISAEVNPQVFRAMCTIHGRDSVDLEKASQPFLLESIEK